MATGACVARWIVSTFSCSFTGRAAAGRARWRRGRHVGRVGRRVWRRLGLQRWVVNLISSARLADATPCHGPMRLAAAEHYAPRRESEPPQQKSGGQAPCRRERGETAKPALWAPARRHRQRRRERHATANAPSEEATAPTTTCREREPPSVTHRAEGANRRQKRTVTERHAAASAAARLSRRQTCGGSRAPTTGCNRQILRLAGRCQWL